MYPRAVPELLEPVGGAAADGAAPAMGAGARLANAGVRCWSPDDATPAGLHAQKRCRQAAMEKVKKR